MISFLAVLAVTASLQSQMIADTGWLADNLTNPDVVILDIATADEFAANHVPGSRPIDPAKLAVTRNGIPAELPSTAELNELLSKAGIANAKRIVICSREPLLATRAFFTFDYASLGDRTAILDGGLPKWIAEKRPLETGAARAIAPVPFNAKPNADVIVDRADLRQRLDTPDALTLIDARPLEQFNGEEAGAQINHAGRIPSAECVPWQSNISYVGGALIFKSAADLRAMYAGLDLSESKPIVVYCRTGMQASMTYFVLRYLGYQPKLYDGSYIEWNEHENIARTNA